MNTSITIIAFSPISHKWKAGYSHNGNIPPDISGLRMGRVAPIHCSLLASTICVCSCYHRALWKTWFPSILVSSVLYELLFIVTADLIGKLENGKARIPFSYAFMGIASTMTYWLFITVAFSLEGLAAIFACSWMVAVVSYGLWRKEQKSSP